MKKIIIIISIIVILFITYLFWQFKKLENSPIYPYNFKIGFKDKKISGLVAFEIENKSDLDFNINSFDLRLIMNEVEISKSIGNKSIPFISGKKSIIEIPYNTNLLGFKGFDLVKFMAVLIDSDSVDIRIIGSITVNKGFINKSIPIDYLIKNFKKS